MNQNLRETILNTSLEHSHFAYALTPKEKITEENVFGIMAEYIHGAKLLMILWNLGVAKALEGIGSMPLSKNGTHAVRATQADIIEFFDEPPDQK